MVSSETFSSNASDISIILNSGENNEIINGNCYQTFILENGDELDIISTNKSVYGYLAVSGEFDLEYQWSSCSINTKANIGANDGMSYQIIRKFSKRVEIISFEPINLIFNLSFIARCSTRLS